MEDDPRDGAAGPSFEEFVAFLRGSAGIPARVPIVPETRFERDLGNTGDDGWELLAATEEHFGVCLNGPEERFRRLFGLGAAETLFSGEGWGPDPADLLSPFGTGRDACSVRTFRVGELFAAVQQALRELEG